MEVETTAARKHRTRYRTRRRAGLGGSVGNSRLTTLTALALLVLLAVEGLTLVSLQTFLSWHIFVGMLLVPVVGLKLASTGYRIVRYYTRHAEYVAAGAPALPLRLLGPVVVLSTLGLFATGVALAVLGPGAAFVLGLHKASFAVWVGAMALHVLAHVLSVPARVSAELRDDGVGGSRVRVGLVASAVVGGAIFATATLPLVAPWIRSIHAAS